MIFDQLYSRDQRKQPVSAVENDFIKLARDVYSKSISFFNY